MSVDAISWAKKKTMGSANRKLVLLLLADYADANWSTFVGQERLAAEADMSKRTVQRILTDFEADGLIRREERRRDDGYRTSDRIYINSAWTSGDTLSRDSQSGDNGDTPQVTATTVSGDNGDNLRRHSLSPQEQLVDPSAEPLARTARSSSKQASRQRFEEHFWPRYPKKVGKKMACELWCRMSIDDQRAAVKALGHYIVFCTQQDRPFKDPERYLKNDFWRDFVGGPPAVEGPVPGVGQAMTAQQRRTANVKNILGAELARAEQEEQA